MVKLLRTPRGYAKVAESLIYSRKPEFVIIGTGRSGTTYFSELLTASGLSCSHEGYYTVKGPTLYNTRRQPDAQCDASWLAVPFLPDDEVTAVHVVRDPFAVIRSLFSCHFFDLEHLEQATDAVTRVRAKFTRFAQKHFEFTGDPLRDSMRWYSDWNTRCEAITDKRVVIERVDQQLSDLSEWFDVDCEKAYRIVSQSANARPVRLLDPDEELQRKLANYPEYPELVKVAERYGYAV
ncbi:hypothetical protein CP97_01465 [Aurantiacibacter atlanticus]|uniref:Sulfotransferase domain-containing protein n=1 Tax=Aurantiacibacter atlanticus TaxID=1648404 RepID=A0A0H4V8R6_9SPHN|nr:sulfotransferase family protein [Aurantiacibacter atlanticus]AKQ41002.1 hypothetical protein CP97_01465 [Aurantiacibacter atlanticus]